MCPKIDVIERECKNLGFGVHLNGARDQLEKTDILAFGWGGGCGAGC
jgi:hypothetical protein